MSDEIPGLEPLDAHTHLGANDPDGYSCGRDELMAALERIDGRAIVFPMQEPGGYREPNDMVIREAEASGGSLFPFCRLDPHDAPLAEAERALAAGARGIKLHPRAEGFALDHPDLQPVFALAEEQRLTILCHAGRGIPALGRHALEACGRYPGMRLILAHAGISDLSWIWRLAPEHPNLFFDTSWWSPSDLQTLLGPGPAGPGPHGQRRSLRHARMGRGLALRHALQVGLDHDQVRGVMGGQAARLLAGEAPLDLGSAPGAGGSHATRCSTASTRSC